MRDGGKGSVNIESRLNFVVSFILSFTLFSLLTCFFLNSNNLNFTSGLVFLPGTVRGLYELVRKPVIYEASSSSSSPGTGSSSNFVLKSSSGSAFLGRVSLGLDVLPFLAVDFPFDGGGNAFLYANRYKSLVRTVFIWICQISL